MAKNNSLVSDLSDEIKGNGEPPESSTILSSGGFGLYETVSFENLLRTVPDDHLVNIPSYNLDLITERAKHHAFEAAMLVGKSCEISDFGHRLKRRYEISAAYTVAWHLKGQANLIYMLADNVTDGRSTLGVDVNKVENNLLHYTFNFIFHVMGGLTRNRANQYALAMQTFFDEEMHPDEAKIVVLRQGPEKLYRQYLEAKQFSKSLEYIQSKENSNSEAKETDEIKSDAYELDGFESDDNVKYEVLPTLGERVKPSSHHLSLTIRNTNNTSPSGETERPIFQSRRTLTSKNELMQMVQDYGTRISKKVRDKAEKDRIATCIKDIQGLISKL